MTTHTPELRRVPSDDRAWLVAALTDALDRETSNSPAVQPLAPEGAPEPDGPLPESTALVIHTSGSTGTPKFVALTADSVRASAEATHEALGGVGQWLIALPSHLIAGLQMLTRSIVGGTDPVFFDGTFKPRKFIAQAERLEHERRYTSLVPVQLAKLLDYAAKDRAALHTLQRFDAILVGGQATSLALRTQAHELRVNIVRTYGMTETSGGVVYDGVEIGDTLIRVREGEVQLSGPTLASGYVADDALTAENFIVEEGTRWFRTGDAGELLGGTLTVTGRLDRVLISGGVNVSLDAVERVSAAAVPDWREVVACPVADETWGERVLLVVEGAHETDTFDAQVTRVIEQIRDELGAAAVPVGTMQHVSVPRLANGKPDVREINALAKQHRKGAQ